MIWMLNKLIEKYEFLADSTDTEFWDASDWAYHHAYVEVLSDLLALENYCLKVGE